MMKKILVLLLFVLCFVAARAGAPQTINFQGKFTLQSGAPLVGNKSIIYRLFSTETGGTPLWVENQSAYIEDGLISSILGRITPLSFVNFSQQLYLEVENSTDFIIYPRIALSSVPSAIMSQSISLPYADSAATPSTVFQIKNLIEGDAITGKSMGNTGVLGGFDVGVFGSSFAGNSGTLGAYDAGATGTNGEYPGFKGYLGTTTAGVVGIYGDSIPTAPTFGYLGNDNYAVGGEHINGNWGFIGGADKAAYFEGRVVVTGTLEKLGGSFKIDHPLDPENKYLAHSFVESPDMKNLYDGIAVLGDDGSATVVLPDWFAALNKDYRYQLTSIGAWAPVYVAEEIANNRFTISGGKPGQKVSWQVTGTRRDAWAEQNRIVVESEKPQSEKGKYLAPKAYGKSVEKAIMRPKMLNIQPKR